MNTRTGRRRFSKRCTAWHRPTLRSTLRTDETCSRWSRRRHSSPCPLTAIEAIDKAVVDAEFILAPMYALKPQQRLGYLENIDQIKCTRSFLYRKGNGGDAFEFKKNEEYDVQCFVSDVPSTL